MRFPTPWLAGWLALAGPALLHARDLYVDPHHGADTANGWSATLSAEGGPVRTIRQGLKLAAAGDTVHLAPTVYRETAEFINRRGEPGRPIVLDGHGATLEGSEPLDAAAWREVSPGLFRHDDLLPLNDAILMRWFFIFEGKLQRMGRSCKAPRAEFKTPETLLPGEWTFVADAGREAALPKKGDQSRRVGSFYVRVAPSRSLAEAQVAAPLRANGVALGGKNEHLTVRNLICQHVHNDGFNVHNYSRAVRFENIQALDSGDDGFSAHDDCQCEIDTFTSRGNGTGICDVGQSETHYRHVTISDAVGFDISFMQQGRHSVRGGMVQSTAHKSIMVAGDAAGAQPCVAVLEELQVARTRDLNAISLSGGAETTLRRCSFANLHLHATSGQVHVEQCAFSGELRPEVQIWQAARWAARRNWYAVKFLRFGPSFYTGEKLAAYQATTGQDAGSLLADAKGHIVPCPPDIGAPTATP